MEQTGRFLDEQWDSLSKMFFPIEDTGFTNTLQLVGDFPHAQGFGLELGRHSNFCPPTTAPYMNGFGGVHDNAYYDSNAPSLCYFSQDSSIDFFPELGHEKDILGEGNCIPSLITMPMDICSMNDFDAGSSALLSANVMNEEIENYELETKLSEHDYPEPLPIPAETQSANIATEIKCKEASNEICPLRLKSRPRKRSRVSKVVSVEKNNKARVLSRKCNQNLSSNGRSEEVTDDDNGEQSVQTASSCCSSEDDSNASHDSKGSEATEGALHLNGKARASRGAATDPQSLYARKRRERINERLKILQNLVPNGTKVDISTMLEEAVHYVKFLQLQIKLLSSEDMWMYAPIAYNGMDSGLNQKLSSLVCDQGMKL